MKSDNAGPRRLGITRRRGISALAALAFAAVGIAAAGLPGASAAPTASAASATQLASVCPNPVVIQGGGTPAVSAFDEYDLAASNGTIDTNGKSYTANLVDQGQNTGVKIKIISGGGTYEYAGAALRSESGVLLADSSTDGDIAASASAPVVEIVAPFQESPLGVMWAPQVHPSWKNIADIGKSDAPIIIGSSVELGFNYLVEKGIIHASQLVKTYTGSPAQFVAAGGQDAQQGFATNEPYEYAHVFTAWLKPVKFEKISDYGYSPYPSPLVTLPQYVTKYAACFKKLVPIIQQDAVDYIANPKATDALIVKLNAAYQLTPYTSALAAWTAKALTSYGIVTNGSNGVYGSFNLKRINQLITISKPLLAQTNTAIASGLTASTIATNQFLDSSIHLPAK